MERFHCRDSDEHYCERRGLKLDLDAARSELAALRAENERLRGALTKARDSLGEPCSVTYGMAYDCSCYICIALSAIRAALAPPEATEGEGKGETLIERYVRAFGYECCDINAARPGKHRSGCPKKTP